MFFSASKIFWLLFAPSHLLLWLVISAAVAAMLGHARASGALSVVVAVLFVLMGLLPFSTWILRPLENRYSRPPWPPHVDGILVLNGGLRTDILRSRGIGGAEDAEARIVAGFELARRYPGARVVLSGGSGDIIGPQYSETEAGAAIFQQLGLDPKRLTLEAASRNTWEDIAFSRRLVRPRPGEIWLLATSAMHMPRAMEVAHRLKWNLIPWPTDYLTARNGVRFTSVSRNLMYCDEAAHEWVGLLAYVIFDAAPD